MRFLRQWQLSNEFLSVYKDRTVYRPQQNIYFNLIFTVHILGDFAYQAYAIADLFKDFIM
jgi:hypothetical protein